MKQQSFYNAAVYCRLSKDDLSHGESSSIQTQKAMLTKYITDNNWRVHDYYVDDGISGTTFEREDFQRMIGDVEAGNINMVITKDLSRLGRDYLKTGYYSEVYFPEHDVRYIAVNDGVDTLNSNNDIAPFKNILNEMYAKDVSKKIKSAYKVKFARGDYQGAFAPFGYAKDPNNHNRLIIDEESATTVRLIFDLARQGYGASKIRNELIQRKLPTPSGYLYLKDPRLYAKKYTSADDSGIYAWWCGAIVRILENEIYIGNIIHYKEISVSYKTQRRQHQPREKWARNENTHPAIIDLETWELIRARFKHRGVHPRIHPPNIFARIIRCADCGKSMFLGTYQKKSQRRYLMCVTYRAFGKTVCSHHMTSYKTIKALVLNDIRQYARLAMEKPDELLGILSEQSNAKKVADAKRARRDFDNSKKRLSDLDLLLQKLFEENATGRINSANYDKLFQKYQGEQEQLEVKIAELEKEITKLDATSDNSQRFVDLIAKYSDLQELDAPIVNELCDKILLHQAYKENGKRTQVVEIFYRFVGKIP